jgi:thiol-disulfide isomerase/thioredoxin
MRPGLAAAVLIGLATLPTPARSPAQDRAPLLGPLTRAQLKTPPYAEWFDSQYSRYQPGAESVAALRSRLTGVSIETYFGTWCGDSRRQVPRLVRLLDLAGFDENRLSLVGLSDQRMEFKQAPGNPERKRYVHRTPTIVVLRDGAEVGRIVETPTTSLEADLIAILEGRGPEPRYGAEAFVHRLFTDMPGAEAMKALGAAGPEVAKRSSPESLWHYAEHDLLKNGRADEARALLVLYLSQNPRSVMGEVLMTEALLTLGRKDEAKAAAGRALALEPTNERALRAQARLREP